MHKPDGMASTPASSPGSVRRLRRLALLPLLPIALPLLLAGCQPRAAAPPPPAPVLEPLRQAEKAVQQMDAATRQREQEVKKAMEGQQRTP